MRIMLAMLLAVALSVSGCTTATDPQNPTDGGVDATAGSGTGDDAIEGAEEEAMVNETDPITATLYMTSTMDLSVDEATAGRIPVPASLSSTWGMARDGEVLRFESDPLLQPAIIQPESLDITAWVEANAPTVATGLYDFGGWIGSTINIGASGVETVGPSGLAPGTPTELEWSLDMRAEDGIFIPAGEAIAFEFGAGVVDENGDMVDLLVGPDHPSRIEITWTVLSEDILDEVTAEVVDTFTGHFDYNGPAYFFTPTHPTENQVEHAITVPQDAAVVRVDSQTTSTGRSDLDMTILDGSTVVGASLAFYADEGILLAGPTLEPYLGKELTLQVNNYVGSDVDYTIDLSIGTHRS